MTLFQFVVETQANNRKITIHFYLAISLSCKLQRKNLDTI